MEPFKNIYNEEEIFRLAEVLKSCYGEFETKSFLNSLINDTWETKELKQRIRAISTAMGEYLPKEYLEALEVLYKAQKEFDGLFHLIFPDFVEVYGLEYYKQSIVALKEFTKNCSSEFAVRPFLIQYPHCIEVLKQWAKDENEHVRRLSSEGCRPRLPWGIALSAYKKDPKPVLEVLELLQDDESEYVRKSVANNLNDISKDNPKLALETFKRWYGQTKQKDWIIKHAARGLLKEGNKEVLELFGYKSEGIVVEGFKCDRAIKLNTYLNFSFTIASKKPLGKLRIEYKMGLLRQKGKINYKMFKISERTVEVKELKIEKSHHFKEVTTRKYYPGTHSLAIVVNGKEFAFKEFELEME